MEVRRRRFQAEVDLHAVDINSLPDWPDAADRIETVVKGPGEVLAGPSLAAVDSVREMGL